MANRTMSDFDRHTKIARNDVLRADDPENATSTANGNETSLWHVAKDVRALIQGCYEFGLNPLPHLRRYFPNFFWKYWGIHDGKERDVTSDTFDQKFIAHVTSQDYTWFSDAGGDWSCGVVSARERNGKEPRKILFESDGGIMPKPREAFTAAGMKIIKIHN